MNIRELLLSHQDLKYKEFHSKLCLTKKEIIGVRIPIIKKIAKEIYKNNNKVYTKIGDKYYEEILLKGFVIALSTESVDKKLKLIEKYVSQIDNWATCDSFCAFLKISKKEKEEYYNFIKKYEKSEEEFEIRFLLIMLLNHYLEEEYFNDILKIINSVKKEHYYVKMAIAWLLSFMYLKDKEYTLSNINTLNIDKWTYNKAIQKTIESNRISKEEKDYLKTLKK